MKKQIVIQFLTVSILSIPSLPVFATVNVKTSAFTKTVSDWISNDQRFALVRQYSSRRLNQGLFGFGWCSTLERSISSNTDGSITFKDCMSDQEDIFNRLKPDMDGRITYARSGTSEIIFLRDGVYSYSANGVTDTFDVKGRWLGRSGPQDNWAFQYSDEYNVPVRVAINGQVLHLESVYKSKRIKRIYASQFEMRYFYRDLDLSLVTGAHNTSYKYDSSHNLLAVRDLSGEVQDISYDESQDRVLSVKNDSCVETYAYSTAKGNGFATMVTAECAGRSPIRLAYYFIWHENRARLSVLEMDSGNEKMQARYSHQEKVESMKLSSLEDSWLLKFNPLGEATDIKANGPVNMLPVFAKLNLVLAESI